jgi:hypothetical protein
MSKRKNLNGVPHNIIRSFFGTERYYNKGYMADWLLNAARSVQIDHAGLDILTSAFTPDKLNIYPLVLHAKTLKAIISKELHRNGFTDDFITGARIDFVFPDADRYKKTIYAYGYLIDKEGRQYTSGKIIETAFEASFDPFDQRNIYPESNLKVSRGHIARTTFSVMKRWWNRLFR